MAAMTFFFLFSYKESLFPGALEWFILVAFGVQLFITGAFAFIYFVRDVKVMIDEKF